MLGIGKWKTEAWEGKVIKKEVFQSNAGDDEIWVSYIHVEMPDGTVERKKCWDPKLYDSLDIGDTLIKRLNEKKPVKG